MKFRPVREYLSEAMAEVVIINSVEELRAVATPESLRHYYGPNPEIKVIPQRWDERIGWNSHIVTVNGQAAGYTDGPLENLTPDLPQQLNTRINIDDSKEPVT